MRVSRFVLALKAHSAEVSLEDLDKLTTKATLLADEYAKMGWEWHPARMVRALRRTLQYGGSGAAEIVA